MIAVLVRYFSKESSSGAVSQIFNFGRFRLGLLVAVIAYNWTEAVFKNISAMWFVFYIIALDYPLRQFVADGQLQKLSQKRIALKHALWVACHQTRIYNRTGNEFQIYRRFTGMLFSDGS